MAGTSIEDNNDKKLPITFILNKKKGLFKPPTPSHVTLLIKKQTLPEGAHGSYFDFSKETLLCRIPLTEISIPNLYE